jgi:hypothetical protein
MLAEYPRVVIIDLKGDVPYPADGYTVIRSPLDKLKWRFASHIMYRPDAKYMNGAAHSYVLQEMYNRAKKRGKRSPFILYVDEALFLANTGAGTWLANLAVATRSMGLGLWVSSQRPKNIPVELRTEAWRWYIFYLSYKSDEKEVSEYTKGRLSPEQLEQGTQSFSFYEIRRGSGSMGRLAIRHYPPVKV